MRHINENPHLSGIHEWNCTCIIPWKVKPPRPPKMDSPKREGDLDGLTFYRSHFHRTCYYLIACSRNKKPDPTYLSACHFDREPRPDVKKQEGQTFQEWIRRESLPPDVPTRRASEKGQRYQTIINVSVFWMEIWHSCLVMCCKVRP